MTDWLRYSRLGRALRYRAAYGWAWLSLQVLVLLVCIRIGVLLGPISWPIRVVLLAPLVVGLYWIADVVSDKVDDLVYPGYAAQNAADDQHRPSSTDAR